MTNINTQIDSTKYGGFISYGQGQVGTLKPGINNLYNKDVYNQICDYENRYVPYFNDKSRYKNIYKEQMVDEIKQSNYQTRSKKSDMKKQLDNYQYTHEPNVLDMFKENLSKKDEDTIRDK